MSDKEMNRVKMQVVPAIAGIEAADKAVAALYELASLEQLSASEANKTVKLAQQGIDMAVSRTRMLQDMSGLDKDSRSEAKTAMTKLTDARTAVRRIEKTVGKKQARLGSNDIEQIREQARSVHEDLSDAEESVERIAKAHDISTDLELED